MVDFLQRLVILYRHPAPSPLRTLGRVVWQDDRQMGFSLSAGRSGAIVGELKTELTAKTGAGIEAWVEWLRREMASLQRGVGVAVAGEDSGMKAR